MRNIKCVLCTCIWVEYIITDALCAFECVAGVGARLAAWHDGAGCTRTRHRQCIAVSTIITATSKLPIVA